MKDTANKIKQLEILVIDPNEDVCNLLKLQLSKEGFAKVKTFSNASSALKYLDEAELRLESPGLVIQEIMLPGYDGFHLCRQISEEYDIPVLIMSARLKSNDEVRSLEAGAADYVLKPYNFTVLSLKIERLLTQQYLSEEVRNSNKHSQKLFLNILQVMAKTLEAKDPYSSFHSQNVSSYARKLARAMDFSQKEVSLIGIAGLLHDIGKIGIKDNILQKEGKLTDDEYERIKRHPMIAAVILEPVEELSSIIETVRYHHERYDGHGYPEGLAGEDIPIGARIMTVADSYDAMTTKRPYRKTPLTQEEAVARLREGAGTQFDPHIVEVFVAHVLEAASPPKTAS